MFSKTKKAVTLRSTEAPPTIQEIDALHSLIETRTAQIDKSDLWAGHTKCYVNPDHPDFIYFPRFEAPPLTSTFSHPINRMPCAVLSQISEAGRVAVTFQQFEDSVPVYTVKTIWDPERFKHFRKLVATNWTAMPIKVDITAGTAITPIAYKLTSGDVFLYRSDYYKVMDTEEKESLNTNTIEKAEVN